MLKKALLLPLLALSPLKAGDPWTNGEIAIEAVFQTLVYIDWRQTSSFHLSTYTDANGVEHSVGERNMMLGAHPKQSVINAACLLTALGHFAISNSMTHRDRKFLQVATIIVEGGVVYGNFAGSVKVRIRW